MISSQEVISIVIVDDHELTRTGIKKILEQAEDIVIVGEASNGDDAFSLVQELQPKVLLLDIQMPGTPAREIERLVREHYPDVVTLILTGHDRDAYLADFMKLGVAGYLDKNIEGDRLLTAIYRAVRGEYLFTVEQHKRVQDWNRQVGEKWEMLSKREREVFRLIADGLDNNEISNELRVSSKTVEFHTTNILRKLNVKSRRKAIVWLHSNMPENFE